MENRYDDAWQNLRRCLVSPVRIRPLGGAVGCLIMIAVSVFLSVVLTVLLNALAR